MPLRTCLGCGQRAAQSELIRVTLSHEGQLRVERQGGGRGGYLHRTAACWQTFIRRKHEYRAFHLQLSKEVKEKLSGHPAIAENIPPEQADAIHEEIATHIHNSVQEQASQPASGVILSELENKLGSGDILTSAVTGGLLGSLFSKFGLSSAVTGAIAASIPGLVQKFMQKNQDTASAHS